MTDSGAIIDTMNARRRVPIDPVLELVDADATEGDGAIATPTEPVPTFEAIYARRYRELVQFAFLLTGDRGAAEDIVQDAFVGLHRRWRSVSDPLPYLRRSVANGAATLHRRRGRDRDRPAPPVSPSELGAAELSDAISALPHRQRAAIVLRFHLDLADRDSAEILGVAPGTVPSLIHRALCDLRKVIQP